MARQLTVDDHGGLSIPIAFPIPRNKLNIIWQQVKSKSDNFCWRLRYMFRSLPKEAELCFLICSIFSDDFRIPIEDLVIYGMGLELFENVHDMFAARCRVHDIINNHKYLCKMINGQVRLAHEEQGPQDQHVKLLADAHVLAKSIASKCPLVFRREIVIGNWLKSNRYEDCYGLSLVLKKVNDYQVNLEFPKLGLLHLQCKEDSQSIPRDFFEGMEKLRVLSLDLPSLPKSFNALRNLKTLRLKVPKLEDMSWIGGLTTLEFLSICVLSLTDVPREMGQLETLRLLDLRKMNIAYIPPGILSRLMKLEALYMPLSFRRWGCKAKKCKDYDEWEFGDENNVYDDDMIGSNISEMDGEERINATLTEIVSLSLKALQISLPKASVLPKRSPIFKNIQEFKILMVDNVRYQPFGKDSANKLQLIGEAIDIKESGVCDLMSKTEELSLIRVRSLKNVLFQQEDNDLSQLKKMIISECDELEHIVDMTEKQNLLEGEYLFRNLECLHLSMLSRLKEICNGKWKYIQWLPNLSEISIRFCHKLKYVFPLSIVKGSKLKSIEILDCNEMEGIFYENEEHEFPIKHCSIEKLELHSLPRLTSLLVHKDTMIDGVHYDDNESLTTKKVNTKVDCVFPSKLASIWLQNLKRLKIAFCDVKVIFRFEENHATLSAFSSLEELELHGLQNLIHVWFQVPPKITAFQTLRLLVLSECQNRYLFSPQVAMVLVQLQKVCISRCKRMKEIIVTEYISEREVKSHFVFPQLKFLELQHMPNLRIFYGGIHETKLPLLESLKLNQCDQMKCFSNGELRTPLLERIEINGSLWSLIGDNLNETMRRFEAYQKGQFFIADLEIATGNFRPNSLVGRGNYSAVYKGWIDQKTFAPARSSTGSEVAIKKLGLKFLQLSEEWQLQVKFLESLSHPNLVKLFGHCCVGEELILVYEFVSRKSLEGYLSNGNSATNILSWNMRISIAIGVARGLGFLHKLNKKAIHGDVQTSNILLDESYNAKLKDYGLAMLWGVSDNNTRRKVMDSYGYAAPESLGTGYFDAKNDVYGFGVVLLELMTGLRAFNILRPKGQKTLVDWLNSIALSERAMKNFMDERIGGQYSTEAMFLAAKLALKCVKHDPESRPSMKEVLEVLEQIDAVKKITG